MQPKQKDKLAKFFYKLAEYTFAGLVIGVFVSRPTEFEKLIGIGLAGTVLLALVGFRLDGLKERRR